MTTTLVKVLLFCTKRWLLFRNAPDPPTGHTIMPVHWTPQKF